MTRFAPHRWILGPMDEGKAIGRFRFLTYLGHGVYDSMIAYHLHENENWGMAEIGYLLSISALMGILIGPAWAFLADAIKKHKQILTVAMIGMCSCIVIQAFSPPRVLFWIAMVLMYFFGAAVNPITTGLTASYASRTENDEDEAKADYGKMQSFGPLGYGIGALLIVFVSRVTGLVIIFYAFAFILVGCVSVLRWFPNESKRTTAWSFRQMKAFFNRKLIGFWMAVFLVTGPLQSFLSIFGMLYQSAGGDVKDIGYATMFGYIIQWAALRYKRHWFDRWAKSGKGGQSHSTFSGIQKWIICSVVLIIGVRWFAIYIHPSSVTFWLAFACQGVGIALLISSFELQITSIAGKDLSSSSIGVLYSMISFAMFGCTALSSFATQITGSVITTALLFGVITIGGLMPMIYTQVKQREAENKIEQQDTAHIELVEEPKAPVPVVHRRNVTLPVVAIGAVVAIGMFMIVRTHAKQIKMRRS